MSRCEETVEERTDTHGVVHTTTPGEARAWKGFLHPVYWCGCRPHVHAFECMTCHRTVGWCFGCDDEYLSDCDDCAVAKMREAARLEAEQVPTEDA